MRINIIAVIFVANVFAAPMVGAQSQSKIVTTIEMRANAHQEFEEADAQLNSTYKTLLSRLTDVKQRELLKSAQRAWLKFRDESAAFEASFYEGGSIQPQIHTISLTTATKGRTQELKRLLETEFDR